MNIRLLFFVLLAAGLSTASSVMAASKRDNVGTVVKLDSLRFKEGEPPVLGGRVTIIEFWATWCPPCQKSIPHLNELYQRFHRRGLEIVGVTKEGRPVVAKFIETLPIHYHIAFDPKKKFGAQFKISGIPHAMLLDHQGRIVWEGPPLRLPEAELEKLLKAARRQ